MEKLLLIALIFGVPANLFIAASNMTGNWVLRLFMKTLAIMYLLFVIIILLKNFKLL
jgi:hypothetical protein